ncbi:MAG: hypothetical protein AMXMBFR34_04050 [Myxococcaceae bacterium]
MRQSPYDDHPLRRARSAATGYSEASSFEAAKSTGSTSFKQGIDDGKKIADKLPDGEVKDAIKTLLDKPYPSAKELEKGIGAFIAARDSGTLSSDELKTLSGAVMKRMALKSTIDFALNSAKEAFQKLANQKPEVW